MSAADKLRELYSELPSLDCLGLCADSCHHIGMTPLEQHIISEAGGPGISMAHSPCPALDFVGRCSVYENRPTICRLWGAVADMPCHYGCKPDRYLSRDEGFSFLRRAREISGPVKL